ncbi:MAG: hypothetical protein KDE20_15630 [Caldilineaceae bacterium]|nr:hypothetical protein [Caldilineaceae bacterium]
MKRTQRTITIMLLALLIGLAISATIYAAPQRPPRRTDTEQRSRPAPTPTVGCYNRMAGTCGHQWYDPNQFDRRTLVPTPRPGR